MRLHQLKPNNGAKHRTKRLGCGESSGHGKTSCRGGKGQTARSGSSIRHGFEGGQTPLYRRLPKRGFNNNRFKTKVAVVNLGDLNDFSDGESVKIESLIAKGLVNGRFDSVKILGSGELKKKLTVQAHLFSASAKARIESLGGKVDVIAPKLVAPKGSAAAKTAAKNAGKK